MLWLKPLIKQINSLNTDVDYSNLTVFLIAFMWPVVESEICLKTSSPVIRFVLNFTKPSISQSLEVVDRGSETQLQVTENLNFITQWSKS